MFTTTARLPVAVQKSASTTLHHETEFAATARRLPPHTSGMESAPTGTCPKRPKIGTDRLGFHTSVLWLQVEWGGPGAFRLDGLLYRRPGPTMIDILSSV
jgi:hypothetical protein